MLTRNHIKFDVFNNVIVSLSLKATTLKVAVANLGREPLINSRTKDKTMTKMVL